MNIALSLRKIIAPASADRETLWQTWPLEVWGKGSNVSIFDPDSPAASPAQADFGISQA